MLLVAGGGTSFGNVGHSRETSEMEKRLGEWLRFSDK